MKRPALYPSGRWTEAGRLRSRVITLGLRPPVVMLGGYDEEQKGGCLSGEVGRGLRGSAVQIDAVCDGNDDGVM